MIDCEFKQIDNNLFECVRCGFTYKTDKIKRNCGPTIEKKIINFGKAILKHVSTGMKKSSQEEIDRRLSICNECPLFQDGICNHNECGCNVSNKQKFMNKLAWADQECPLGKWRI